MRLVRIALASINATVGAVRSNTDRVLARIEELEAQGVTVAAFPEQCLGGYPSEDLVQWRGFVDAQWAGLQRIAEATKDKRLVVAVGLAVGRGGHLYNAAAVVHAGRVLGVVPKEKLPTYGVFYEMRTFSPGVPHAFEAGEIPFGDMVFDFDFGTLGVEVCEDVWSPDGPLRRRCYAGAELMLNLSASPYRMGIVDTRREMLATRSADNQCTFAYVNLVGANDGLIFDGGGFLFSNGRPLLEAPRFREGVATAVVDLDRTIRLRRETTTWRIDAQAHAERNPRLAHVSSTAPTADRDKLPYPVPASGSFFLPSTAERPTPRALFCEDLLDALALGIGDYYEKTGAFKGIGVALSGGRDSLLTVLLAHRYLERRFADLTPEARRVEMDKHLHCFYMPSKFSSDETFQAAETIAQELGARFAIIPIDEAKDREGDITLTMTGGVPLTGLTKQNIQARLRGLRMWNWSNTTGFLFLQTGNMSEKACGYTTIGGDLEGALGVLANVPKTVVILLLEYLLETRGFEGIRLAFRAPAGPELEANQQGENELMPFQVLDACFYLHAAEKLAADEITAALGSMFPMYGAEQLGSWVAKLRRLFAMNIYKWVQAPLSLHVGNLDLERERALQLPVVERNEW
jgi:NAD+ synthase (glutamine-hydrolysing)